MDELEGGLPTAKFRDLSPTQHSRIAFEGSKNAEEMSDLFRSLPLQNGPFMLIHQPAL